MRVAIVGHVARAEVQMATRRLSARLAREGHEVQVEERLAREIRRPGAGLASLARWCDVMISLGGDGTALRGARAMAGQPGALLPVNLGGLGFLTSAEESELDEAVTAALAGTWSKATRRLLEVTVVRQERRIHRGLAMNDAVVKASGGYAALHLRLIALGSDLGHLVADGVIAASAAGSTAYSLSAGGPVLAHDLEAMVITPVCPHTLGSRSLVLSGKETVTIKVLGSLDQPMLMLDGQDRVDLVPDDAITVGLARAAVRVFVNPEQPLARVLRDKLGWQGSERRSLI